MRYTRDIREQIDRCIHDANIANFSEKGTVQFIKDKTGITVGHTQLVDRKRYLRNMAIKTWNTYRNDDYAYRLEHLERVCEAKRVRDSAIRQMFKYEDDPKKFIQWKMAGYLVLEASKHLADLSQKIPEIDVIGHDYGDNNYEMEQGLSVLPEQQEGNAQF